jgi:Protein of unknown function (DUF2934)
MAEVLNRNLNSHNMKKTKRNTPDNLGNIPKVVASEERIRQRAQEIYEASCGVVGNELDHWLQAERELKAQKNPRLEI